MERREFIKRTGMAFGTIRLGDILNPQKAPEKLTPMYAIERLRAERLQRDTEAVKKETLEILPLRDYIRKAWHVVEPSTHFIANWHIDAIAEHLDAVIRGEIKNLLINMPPRHMKSITVSVMWPTHTWTYNPAFRWLFASYAQGLATRDAVKSRRIIDSPWYQEHWGERFQLTSDQNQKMRYENDRTGYRISTSVDGSATGEGGDAIVCDDPHNIRRAHSETDRAAVIEWWDQVMSTRLNDPQTGRRVIIMQRVHEKDLSGHVLEEAGYEHLCLPTEFEPARRSSTSIGWTDPRTKPKELLNPDRFGEKEVTTAKKTLGSYGFSGQHQQSPSPPEGGIFKRAWFRIVPVVPAGIVARVRFWDCAGTEEDGNFTVGTLMAKLDDGRFLVEHVVRGQWSPGVVDTTIQQTAASDGRKVRIREEQEPGSSGKTVIAARKLAMAGYDYDGRLATGEKETRWLPFAVQAEAGNVLLLEGLWIRDWLDEMANVPNGAHDDQADSAAGGFIDLALGGKKKARTW